MFQKGCPGTNFFCVMLNLRSEIFWNFFIYRALWTLNFWQWFWAPIFVCHTKFEVKNFFRIFSFTECCELCSFCRGESGHPLFWVTLNLRSDIFWNFFIYTVLWTLNFSQEVRPTTFFGHVEFEVKMFSEFFPLSSSLDSEFVGGGGSGHQLSLVMLNLRSKFFWNLFIYIVLWTLHFSEGVSGHQLFGDAKFETKKFF